VSPSGVRPRDMGEGAEMMSAGILDHATVGWLWNDLLVAGLIVFGAALIGRFVHWVLLAYRSSLERQVKATVARGELASEQSKRSRALVQALDWVVQALVYAVATIAAVRQLGVPLTSLVAPATVAGVALGFGAQQMVADLLAGFWLFAEHQFGIGDLVALNVPGASTGVSGTVEELTLRITKLRTQHGELVMVPNSAMRQVTNLSRDWSRIVIDLPIPVEEDLDRVIQVVDEVVTEMASEDEWKSYILGRPVVAGVENIEVGYVQLRVLMRTLPGRQFEVGRELRLRLANRLREMHIMTSSTPTSS
jgi:moderate conductance mechanosensitive channel